MASQVVLVVDDVLRTDDEDDKVDEVHVTIRVEPGHQIHLWEVQWRLRPSR